MSALGQRVVTAVVLLVLLASALFIAAPPFASYLLSAFLLIGLWEWSGFLRLSLLWQRLVCFLVGLVLALAVAATLMPGSESRMLAALVAVQLWWLAMLGWLVWGPRSIRSGLTAIAGVACLVPAWCALLVILSTGHGPWQLLWLVAIVAAADTGAYFCGRAFGRHKLAPSISPGKTIEGLLGGLVLAAIAGATGAWLAGFEPLGFALVGVSVGLISVVGDLSVSAFKRNAGLKDSGWVLPGHGGVLDRIDGLLPALPLFLLLLLVQDQI